VLGEMDRDTLSALPLGLSWRWFVWTGGARGCFFSGSRAGGGGGVGGGVWYRWIFRFFSPGKDNPTSPWGGRPFVGPTGGNLVASFLG